MTRLKCPQCAVVFAPVPGVDPSCPSCGYQAAPAAMPTPTFSRAGPVAGGGGVGMTPPGSSGYAGGGAFVHIGGKARTHWSTVSALVAGILSLIGGFFFAPFSIMMGPFGVFFGSILGVLAIVFGSIGIRVCGREPDKWSGRGMAVAGLVMGIISVAITVLVALFMFLFFWAIFGGFVAGLA